MSDREAAPIDFNDPETSSRWINDLADHRNAVERERDELLRRVQRLEDQLATKQLVGRELARPGWRADLTALFERWQALPLPLQRGTIIYLFGGLGVYDKTELGLTPELLLRAIEASEKELPK